METKKLLTLFDIILLAVLAISMIFFFIGSVSTFNLGDKAQISLLIYLFLTYLIILILVLRFKGILIEVNRRKIVNRFIDRPVEKIIEKPVIKYVDKIKTVYIDKTKEPVKKFKYYGSTLANTYHKEKCRFSGMIKKEHLILRNVNTYFKKKKFHACKNCNPGKK